MTTPGVAAHGPRCWAKIGLVAELRRPTTRVHTSWLAAVQEPGYDPAWAQFLDLRRLADPDAFAAYVAAQIADADETSPRRDGWVPATHLWYVKGTAFLGRLSIRHRLTPWLRDYGGHIGYDVRPSARRRGHATRMLQLALPWCRELGIDPVLVTCDVDNEASRRVIEHADGVFENQRYGKLRYWVPTLTPSQR
jgi:predicted acetyltransferase